MIGLLNWLGIGGIVAAAWLTIDLHAFSSPPQAPEPLWPPAASAPSEEPGALFADFPEGKAVEVELNGMAVDARSPSARELRDQALDWLLTAIVSRSGASAREVSQALYDTAPLRRGFLRPYSHFEYGPTRQRLLGESVVAVIPAGPAGDRLGHLADVSDAARKDLGHIPRELWVFEYELELKEGRARLTRLPKLPGGEQFAEASGYVEQRVDSLAALTEFLGVTRDLTSVRLDGDALVLGGRTAASGIRAGIDLEQVATIWSAQQRLDGTLAQFNARAKAQGDAIVARWERAARARVVSVREGQQRVDAEVEQMQAQLAQQARAEHVVEGLGFSLDPEYDWDRLQWALRRLERLSAAQPQLLPPAKLDAAVAGAAKQDIGPFLALRRQLRDPGEGDASSLSPEQRIAALLEEVDQDSRFQKARYDGAIQGTEVGMVLFYTDLIAKLWALDFLQSGSRNPVDGFAPMTQAEVSPALLAQQRLLSSTRVWFGHRDDGFQVEANSIAFARNATRIFAASSDPLYPGLEVEASASSEAFLGWWNDHYEEVAAYEPQYQRLNAIMKWSLVVSWLSQRAKQPLLGFLGDVPTRKDLWFPSWAKAHPELKFGGWSAIAFFDEKSGATEQLPLLASEPFVSSGDVHVLSGGVSLGSKQVFAAGRELGESIIPSLRRSPVDYAKSGANKLEMLDGSAFALSETNGMPWVEVTPRPNALSRSVAGELRTATLQTSYATDTAGAVVNMRLGKQALGDLRVVREGEFVSVTWRPSEVDIAGSLAREVSRVDDPLAALAKSPEVESILKLDADRHLAVRLRNSESWLEMDLAAEPSADLPHGWDARIAEPAVAKRTVLTRFQSDASLRAQLPDAPVFEVQRAAPDAAPVLTPIEGGKLPGVPIELGVGGESLPASASRSAIYVRPAQDADVSAFARRIAFDDVQNAARSGAGARVEATGTPAARKSALIGQLETSDVQSAAQSIASDVRSAARDLQQHLTSTLAYVDDLLTRGRHEEALEELNVLDRLHPNRAEVLERRALARLGRARKVTKTPAAPADPPAAKGSAYFKEVNERLKQAAPGARRTLRNEATFIDFLDHRGKPDVRPGRFSFSFEDGHLRLRLFDWWWSRRHAKAVSADDFARAVDDGAAFYVEDAPGLNGHDWFPSGDHGAPNMPGGAHGYFVDIDPTATHFRPTEVYTSGFSEPHQSVKFKFKGRPSRSDDCDDDDDDCYRDAEAAAAISGSRPIYLVVASPSAGP